MTCLPIANHSLSRVLYQSLCMVLALCFTASLAPAASMHADDVDRANSLLQRAEVNLESVASSVKGRTS
ncbi:MAG: hypothetical protein ACIAQU_11570, partial [Phycisphaerales bacterium JB064]